ncbi:hypothetical protein KP509_09G006100 [Ceratopteris richardii]|nr:hypothetical protein KP509_09G006100 [Ceratopteris richardii]
MMFIMASTSKSISSTQSSFNYTKAEPQQRSVTYDERAIVIDGERKLLISASIHYPRSTPEMWPDLIAKAKEGGVDVIESYMFWNMHEPQRGQFVFEGRLDLIRFIRETHKAGLYFHLRIGPYACAEWNYGGFPAWLHFLEGIRLRTDNAVFKSEMERITTKIVDMVKDEKLFYWQGGPVIMAQIENEYGLINKPYEAAGKRYVKWAAKMALGLDTKVPWVMCAQKDAPDPVINTCNGFYCDHFKPNSPKKPKIWTENWTGWFLAFGGTKPRRPVEDVAFAVARFFQSGGTFQNYYMYHGGTNFERTAGGPFIATSYDYDAPVDEYGLINQPKWGHLKDLHDTLHACERPLLHGTVQHSTQGHGIVTSVYKTKEDECCAFLSNKDDKFDKQVYFRGTPYQVPAWSVSLLPDCKTVAFNTAQVKHQTTVMNMNTVEQKQVVPFYGREKSTFTWESFKEPIGIWDANKVIIYNGLKDQMNTTRDTTDYMWYITSVYSSNISVGISQLSLRSLGHSLLIFLNGEFKGHAFGSYEREKFQLQLPLKLKDGKNELAFLSTTVGLKNFGPFFDIAGTGIDGPVSLTQAKTKIDISKNQWKYQIGLLGEKLNLQSERMNLSTHWDANEELPISQPMIWYKTSFISPSGYDPVAINLESMGKGAVWVNGHGLGRYWSDYTASNLECEKCSYRGKYHAGKCSQHCGQPSQRWFHIPRAWVKPTYNLLVIFEETGGDPSQIRFVTRAPGTVCSHVSEAQPMLGTVNGTLEAPTMMIECGPNQKISSIGFASYGSPRGSCQDFTHGRCHAYESLDIVRQACIGKQQCSLSVKRMGNLIGKDPCPGRPKSLAVQALCASESRN